MMGFREGDHLVFRDDLLRAVEELGGQLLFFMHIAYWDKTLEERWLDYFNCGFIVLSKKHKEGDVWLPILNEYAC